MKDFGYLNDLLLRYYFPACLNFYCGTNIDMGDWHKKLENPEERKRLQKMMDEFDWSPLGDPDWMEE